MRHAPTAEPPPALGLRAETAAELMTPNPVSIPANALVGEAITARAVREKLTAQLMEPIPDTPAEFRARIDADIARWTPVIEAAQIKIN